MSIVTYRSAPIVKDETPCSQRKHWLSKETCSLNVGHNGVHSFQLAAERIKLNKKALRSVRIKWRLIEARCQFCSGRLRMLSRSKRMQRVSPVGEIFFEEKSDLPDSYVCLRCSTVIMKSKFVSMSDFVLQYLPDPYKEPKLDSDLAAEMIQSLRATISVLEKLT